MELSNASQARSFVASWTNECPNVATRKRAFSCAAKGLDMSIAICRSYPTKYAPETTQGYVDARQVLLDAAED